MKKAIIYILIFSVLAAQTELHELLKIPFLVCHYFEDSELENDLSFFEFIHDHYCESQHCEGHDHAQDLPFKDCQNCSYTLVCGIPPIAEFYSFAAFPSGKDEIASYTQDFVSGCILKIWQPPKLNC